MLFKAGEGGFGFGVFEGLAGGVGGDVTGDDFIVFVGPVLDFLDGLFDGGSFGKEAVEILLT